MTIKSLNLVVVEDDEQDYEFFSRALKKCNFHFEITWLKDGEEAIHYLERMKSFDLQNPHQFVYFIDINLPKVQGFELIKIIKGHPLFKESYVVMLSGSKSEKDIDISKENGSSFYLVKPFGKQEVIEFIDKINSIFNELTYE
jgi:two-component system response regulator